jgi:uncharacterized repeat protein (TIGR01451 family)
VIADVTTTSSFPAAATAGSTVNGTVTFSNDGPATASGVTYTLAMEPGLGTVTFPSLPPGATATYDNATGGVSFTGMPPSLPNGETLTVDVSYTAPASGSVTVTSQISTTTSQGANVLPDTASSTTNISPVADVTTSVSVPASANAGATVAGTVTFNNSGPSTADGVTYTLSLDPGLGTVTFPTLPPGVTASYDDTSGAVTFTNMPTSLNSGQTLTVALSYTAPGSGSVTATSHISTTTSQGVNTLPDTASGTTNISPVADVTTSVSVPPAATAGATVNGTVTFTNAGPSTAAGATYTLSLDPGLGTITFPTLPPAVTASYDNTSGMITLTGMPTTLLSGEALLVGVSYTAPPSGSVTLASHISTSTSQGTNTLPDAASGVTNISPVADVTTGISVPASALAGSTVNGTVTFSNAGPSTAAGVTYTLSLPPGLGTVSFPSLPPGVAATYSNATGAVTLTGMSTDLASGATLTLGFSYTAPDSGSVTANTQISTTTSQGVNTLPDTASGTTNISPAADVTTSVSLPPTATAGTSVNGTVSFSNAGPSTADGVTYTLVLTPGLGTVTFPSLPAGVTAGYDTGSGSVSFIGMPTSLASGAALSVGFTFAAPASGLVTANSAISTTTSQGVNALPDTASAATNISPAADVTTSVSMPPAALAGATVNGTVTFANAGPSTAAGVTYSLTLTPGLGAVSFPSLPPGVTATYNNATGIVTLNGMPTSLASGGTSTIGFTFTAPASGTVAANSHITTTTSQGLNALSDSASGATNISPAADVTTSVSLPPAAAAGTGVNGTVTFANAGPATASGVTYTMTLTPGQSGVFFPSLPPGAGATYNSATGVVTLSGMPTTLASGATLSVGFSFTAPNGGSVSVDSSIATSTSEGANVLPNTATGHTTVVLPQFPDLEIRKRHSGSFRVGQTGTYTITVANVGQGNTAGLVMVTDNLPTGMQFVTAAGAGWTCSGAGSAVVCSTASVIHPGESSFISLVVSIADASTAVVTNSAIVYTAGDVNPNNNRSDDVTNIVGVSVATPLPTPPINPTSRPVPTPTRRVARRAMGARFVSVGRVNRGSTLHYSSVVLIYSRSLVPGVTATLTLPAQVQFMNATPAPIEAPAVGASGVVRWNLGDLQGPGNHTLDVMTQVRSDVAFGERFRGYLHVENSFGEAVDKQRVSYVGRINYHAAIATDLSRLATTDRTGQVAATIMASRTVRPGKGLRYTLKVSGATTPADLLVRSLVPAGLTVDGTSPAATVDAQADGPTQVEWAVTPATRRSRFTLYTHADTDVLPGDRFESFFDVTNDVGGSATVSATTTVR